ncbi:MAG TPA: hypothetical protein VJN42_10020 [Candidatus Acidoferrum sp.]|nr:hypothetical protein [Candidatus Acidoferrum sp.]
MTYSYRAYGLKLTSNTPICALRHRLGDFGAPDVAMIFGPEPGWVRDAKRMPICVERLRSAEPREGDRPFALTSFGQGEFFLIAYCDGTRFMVDKTASRLWGACPSPLTEEDLATYLLGPVLGFVLRQRGITALHSSSVCLNGKAVIFCGASGSGKSTTAAALALRGVPLLTEDISPLRESCGALHVEPGYPRVCLWPESVAALLGSQEALPRLTPSWEKRYLGLQREFETAKREVGVVYILAPRVSHAGAPRIEQLGAREALLGLVQNTYMNWLLDRDQRGAELHILAKLVESVPVCKLVPHRDPARIGALCDLIAGDARRQIGDHSFAAAGYGR